MNLENYLKKHETNAGLARKLKVVPSLISQWRLGTRPVPVERCPEIELVTNGLVSRKDLKPDNWHLIWPELAQKQASETNRTE